MPAEQAATFILAKKKAHKIHGGKKRKIIAPDFVNDEPAKELFLSHSSGPTEAFLYPTNDWLYKRDQHGRDTSFETKEILFALRRTLLSFTVTAKDTHRGQERDPWKEIIILS